MLLRKTTGALLITTSLIGTSLTLTQFSYASCPMGFGSDSVTNRRWLKMNAAEETADYLRLIESSRHSNDDLPQDPGFLSRLYNLGLDAAGLYDADLRWGMFVDRRSYKEQRRKPTHRLSGVTAPVILSTQNADPDHPFTGFFKTGTSLAILRFSSAPGIKAGPLTPSISIKLPRDYLGNDHFSDGQALSLSVISRLEDESGKANAFFETVFTNNLKPPVGFLKRFVAEFDKTAAELNKDPRTNINPPFAKLSGLYLPQTAFAQTDSTGQVIENFVQPYIVEFRPTDFMKKLPKQQLKDDFRLTILNNVPTGTVMFEVYANGLDKGRFYKVFEVINTEEFCSSGFGNAISMPHNPGFL